MAKETFEAMISPSRFGRRLLQETSSTSPPISSQASFIALICVIVILSVAIVILIIVLCCRYYSCRGRKSRPHKKFEQILSYPDHPPPKIPIAVTPSSASPYTIRSSDQLVLDPPDRQHLSTASTTPSRRCQPSMMEAYLNDIHTYQPANVHDRERNSLLFIDLHSTSSETLPSTLSKHLVNHQYTNNTSTSGYHTSVGEEHPMKPRPPPQRSWRRSTMKNIKSSHSSRFLMRERSLPKHLGQLPQLRQGSSPLEMRYMNGSSLTTNNHDLLSTNISTTTDDYDDSHAYHVNHYQTIQEEKLSHLQNVRPYAMVSSYARRQPEQPHFFEVVSNYHGDDSDQSVLPRPSVLRGHGVAYIDDSIIV